jgi:hypothetical protein
VKKSLLILPLVLLASALALSACGGGSSSSSGGGEEAAIEEAIETSATSTEPSKCTEVQTEAFNEAETGLSGAEALKTCEEEAESEEAEPAESVTVSNVSVNGKSATAEVAIEGSALDGQGVEIGLAKEEGDWKLNEFLGFSRYDAAGIASFLEGKLNEEEGVEASLVKCIAEGVEGMSQEDAEAMVFEKNQEGFEEIAKSCQE